MGQQKGSGDGMETRIVSMSYKKPPKNHRPNVKRKLEALAERLTARLKARRGK